MTNVSLSDPTDTHGYNLDMTSARYSLNVQVTPAAG